MLKKKYSSYQKPNQHRSELEENAEKEIFFISEANHTNHLYSSHKYTEYTAEIFKSLGKKSKSPF